MIFSFCIKFFCIQNNASSIKSFKNLKFLKAFSLKHCAILEQHATTKRQTLPTWLLRNAFITLKRWRALYLSHSRVSNPNVVSRSCSRFSPRHTMITRGLKCLSSAGSGNSASIGHVRRVPSYCSHQCEVRIYCTIRIIVSRKRLRRNKPKFEKLSGPRIRRIESSFEIYLLEVQNGTGWLGNGTVATFTGFPKLLFEHF